jgi:MFS family permease
MAAPECNPPADILVRVTSESGGAIASLRIRAREAGAAFGLNLRNRELRLAQLSFGAGWASEWAFTVALSVVAFHDGGAQTVGLVALVRLAPSAVLGPFAATLADRFRRDLVLGAIGIIRAASIGAAAVLLVTVSTRLQIYGLALVATTALTPFRAANSALLPSLCRSPQELTSAMVVRGMLDSLSILIGPAIAGLLLAVSGPAAAFAVVAGASLLSALLMFGLRYEVPPRQPGTVPVSGLWAQTVEGVKAISRASGVGLLTGMAVAQAFTRGCLTVFSVVVSINLLKLGDSGVGLLNGAVGVGAVIGSLAVSLLVGSRRLGGWFSLGIAGWGAPLALIAAFPSTPPTLALLACIGVANALVDVTIFTLIGRLVEDRVLGRVNGVLESVVSVAVGLGSVVTPFVIAALGTRGALVALGSICPAVAVLGWTRLRVLDRTLAVRTDEIQLLRSVPMLHALPAVTIEQLARAVQHERIHAGEDVCVQGAPGDTFYVIESGDAEVLGDGQLVRTLGPGDYFGEIALLRKVPRTATVRARSELGVSELTRDVFIPVVSGYGASVGQADAVIGDRLAAFTPGGTGG